MRENLLPPHRLFFLLTARVLLYASSHWQDNTYHSLCYTSHGVLAGTRNNSMGPPWRIDLMTQANVLTTELISFSIYHQVHCIQEDCHPRYWDTSQSILLQQSGEDHPLLILESVDSIGMYMTHSWIILIVIISGVWKKWACPASLVAPPISETLQSVISIQTWKM